MNNDIFLFSVDILSFALKAMVVYFCIDSLITKHKK